MLVFNAIIGRLFGAFLVMNSIWVFNHTVPEQPGEDFRNWVGTVKRPLRIDAERAGLAMGAAVDWRPFKGERPYRYFLQREFNLLVAENVMKFVYLQPRKGQFNFALADELVAFAEKYNMKVRGHTLLWAGQQPKWFSEGEWTVEELKEITENHIRTVVGHFKGRIAYWDVVNEAVSSLWGMRETVWQEKMGTEHLDFAFKAAHEADPAAKLFYNDFLAEDLGRKSDRVYKLVKGMLDRGVPVHGVGLQGHTLFKIPERDGLVANMKRLGALGLEVHLTEVDVGIPQPQTSKKKEQQAILYWRLMDACLSVPACTAFTTWGMSDRYNWIDRYFRKFTRPLLLDDQYEPKLAWYAVANRLQQGRGALNDQD